MFSLEGYIIFQLYEWPFLGTVDTRILKIQGCSSAPVSDMCRQAGGIGQMPAGWESQYPPLEHGCRKNTRFSENAPRCLGNIKQR